MINLADLKNIALGIAANIITAIATWLYVSGKKLTESLPEPEDRQSLKYEVMEKRKRLLRISLLIIVLICLANTLWFTEPLFKLIGKSSLNGVQTFLMVLYILLIGFCFYAYGAFGVKILIVLADLRKTEIVKLKGYDDLTDKLHDASMQMDEPQKDMEEYERRKVLQQASRTDADS
jgi:hypothetical protein